MKQSLWWASAAWGQVLPGGSAEFGAADDQRLIEQPALFQVLHQRGERLVELRDSFRWSSISVWLSQLLFEPTSNSSTTRTPRSTSRRATRHWAANDEGSPAVAP